jgi:hypothetical protein
MTRHGNKSIARASSTPRYTSSQSSYNANNKQEVEKPGMTSSIIQGFGLGAGQSIAYNIFRNNKEDNTYIPLSKQSYTKEYEQCMKDNNNDKELCKQFSDRV